MNVIEYKNGTENQYHEDLRYWSNCCGELHHHGEYDITEKDLPEELLMAYNELWTDCSGSLCYLVEYKGEYRIALINEFDETYAKDIDSTMDALYQHMKIQAKEFSSMDAFANAQIIIAQEMGCFECHEFVVLLPCNTSKELFSKVANILHEKLYK